MQIPVFRDDFSPEALDQFIQTGFCYVLPPDEVMEKLQLLFEESKKFFQEPLAEKEKFAVQNTDDLEKSYQGYILRNNENSQKEVEQFFFNPPTPYGPYEQYSESLKIVNHFYSNLIHILLEKIFQRLNFSAEDGRDLSSAPSCSIVFQRYKKMSASKDLVRFHAHRDYGVLTFLYVQDPGLEVHDGKNWQAIQPLKNGIIVNIGNALEKMTNGRCRSALHRVLNLVDDRMAIVYFVNANYAKPVMNYDTGQLVDKSGLDFFKKQFTQYHEAEY